MILECIQRERLPLTRHEFIKDGVIFAKAETPKRGYAKLNFGADSYEVRFQSFKKISVLKNSIEIGSICPQLCVTKKFLFLKTGYEYYEFNLDGDIVSVYETGFGANRHYYSIYRADKVIAVIHKPDKVVNYLDNYICYVEKNEDAVFAVLYCMFLESNGYYNLDAIGNVVDSTQTVTMQKELTEKFDQGFIDRIIDCEKNG